MKVNNVECSRGYASEIDLKGSYSHVEAKTIFTNGIIPVAYPNALAWLFGAFKWKLGFFDENEHK